MDKCISESVLRSRFAMRKVLQRYVLVSMLGVGLVSISSADDTSRPGSVLSNHTSSVYQSKTGGWQTVGSHADYPATTAINKPSAQPLTTRQAGASAGDPEASRGVVADDIKPDTDRQQSQPPSPSKDIRATPATINLDMFVGQVEVVEKVDVKRVAIGNGAIVRAEVIDTGELLIIAVAAGSSSIRLWNKDGTQTDYNLRVAETDSETRVQMQRIVRMRVRMVEFRKSALGRLGIDWSDSAAGPGLATVGDAVSNNLYRPAVEGFTGLPNNVAPFSTYFGIASNITSRINFLAQNGDAVTLATPVLSAMNGGEASFLAGGEVPYPSVGENGQTQVEFKEYGVKLNVAPLIDSAGNVRAKLETEISQLDSSVSVQGTPGLLTRRAQTEVTVRSGETIVISGLLSSESSADTDMLPGLGKLPIIGRFFSSKSKRNAVNELVIFITPEVIEPGEPVMNSRERDYLYETDNRLNTVRQQLPLME